MKDYCLVVVDVQGKLARLMHDREVLFNNIQILIRGAILLDIPIIWCQQCPDALGPTAPQIEQLLTEAGVEPINKASFSCCGEKRFNDKLKKLGSTAAILCGIETHVCIYQTAVDLRKRAIDVEVIEDAVSSRTQQNKQTAINRLLAEGIKISCTEMILFELVRTAKHPKFKEIARLIK